MSLDWITSQPTRLQILARMIMTPIFIFMIVMITIFVILLSAFIVAWRAL